MSSIRSGISSAFAGTTFSGASVLTNSYLSTIDMLIITTVGGAGGGPPVVLSAAEQAALLAYINGGGGALLITDNGGFGAGNASFVAPFGLVATNPTGTPLPNVPVNIVNSVHPVTNGPFGAITNYDVDFTGAYDSIGPYAIGLARASDPGNAAIDNKFVLAAISPGLLSASSGGVVFTSDLNLRDGDITSNLQMLVNNSIAFAIQPAGQVVPEPAGLALWLILVGVITPAIQRMGTRTLSTSGSRRQLL